MRKKRSAIIYSKPLFTEPFGDNFHRNRKNEFRENLGHLEVVLQGRRFCKEEVGVLTRNITHTVSPCLPNVLVLKK